jgi:UDP-N-acetylmuramoyl-tripeptide--D-alanyl-D-alanine ligase
VDDAFVNKGDIMSIWTNKSLSEALQVQVGNDFIQGNILQFNSRDVEFGDVFIALQGENGNGHDYALDAINRGASIVILERYVDNVPQDKIAIVEDTMIALRKMAEYKRANSKAVFIAVTGSAGKTSIKEALLHTLSHFGKSFASRGSFNNILGIALDLASMADDIKYAIFEVGMNHSGEIRALIPYIKPNIALINNILPVHIGNFASLDGIADAKLEILEGLVKDGTAVLNQCKQYYDYCYSKARALGIGNIVSFSDSEYAKDADSVLMQYSFSDNIGMNIVKISGKDISFRTKIGGRYRALNLAAILLICKILRLDLEKSALTFASLEEPKGRGRTQAITYNGKSCIMIDDAYNASPVTVKNSLEHFKAMKHAYKIAILGDMRELGSDEIEYHTGLLPQIINAEIDKLYTVGTLMYELHKILPVEIKGTHFSDYKEVESHLKEIIDRDLIILLKASKGIKLWHVVDTLLIKE